MSLVHMTPARIDHLKEVQVETRKALSSYVQGTHQFSDRLAIGDVINQQQLLIELQTTTLKAIMYELRYLKEDVERLQEKR